MDNEAALRRMIEQVEQMRQQHTADDGSHLEKIIVLQASGNRASIRRHPFVDGIMETPLPFGWKPLHIDRYDDMTDPDEHIDLYITQLPAELIDNFDTLVRRFMAQYATSRPHHVTSVALASLRQGDDESLRAFMERFASISVKIHNLNPEVALHAMLMALKPGPFVRGKSQAKPDNGHKDKMKVTNDSQFKKIARANKGGRYDFYTPLNTPQVHILEEASNSNLLTLPPPGHTPNSADKSKHCRYHSNHGHTIEECRTLQDRIEELIQAGHLGQYVQRQ
ncbi:uncharacterized protein LOC109801634 [Cajanus cajan]|uniref:uncharacterized protein LOC109801634 n=1 Tax=Cajanus cajan TaxID=3821 RepID=UPI00098DBD64|nr:uncharacterized protein LOC109801634 [Cajanus cajan]